MRRSMAGSSRAQVFFVSVGLFRAFHRDVRDVRDVNAGNQLVRDLRLW